MSCLTSDLFLKVTRLIWSLLFRAVSNWFSLPSFALMTQRYNVKYCRFKIQLPWWPSGLRLHSWTTLLKPHSCTRRRRSGNWLPHPEAKMQSVLKLRSTRTEVRGHPSRWEPECLLCTLNWKQWVGTSWEERHESCEHKHRAGLNTCSKCYRWCPESFPVFGGTSVNAIKK